MKSLLLFAICACSKPTPSSAPQPIAPVTAPVTTVDASVDAYSVVADAEARLSRSRPLQPLIGRSVVVHDLFNGTIQRVCRADLVHFVPAWENLVAQAFPERPRCNLRSGGPLVVCSVGYVTPNHHTAFLSMVLNDDLSNLLAVASTTRSFAKTDHATIMDDVKRLFEAIEAPDPCP